MELLLFIPGALLLLSAAFAVGAWGLKQFMTTSQQERYLRHQMDNTGGFEL